MPFGATANWTGYSPTVGANGSVIPSTSGTLQFGNSALVNALENRWRRTQMRPWQKIVRALNGVVAGSTATATRGRVVAKVAKDDPSQIGGLVSMEVINLVNRATTAADQTYINSTLDKLTAPSPYVADASGNGGGGKLGF